MAGIHGPAYHTGTHATAQVFGYGSIGGNPAFWYLPHYIPYVFKEAVAAIGGGAPFFHATKLGQLNKHPLHEGYNCSG